MPIASIQKILRPEDGVEFISSYLENSSLPIKSVNKYDEVHIVEYPAVQIMSGGFTKEIHGTHTWALGIRVDVYVLHAVLTENRATRNLNDLLLATQIVAFLEADMTFGQRIIHGWVENERPGISPPGLGKAAPVISTLLQWRGTNEGRF